MCKPGETKTGVLVYPISGNPYERRCPSGYYIERLLLTLDLQGSLVKVEGWCSDKVTSFSVGTWTSTNQLEISTCSGGFTALRGNYYERQVCSKLVYHVALARAASREFWKETQIIQCNLQAETEKIRIQ